MVCGDVNLYWDNSTLTNFSASLTGIAPQTTIASVRDGNWSDPNVWDDPAILYNITGVKIVDYVFDPIADVYNPTSNSILNFPDHLFGASQGITDAILNQGPTETSLAVPGGISSSYGTVSASLSLALRFEFNVIVASGTLLTMDQSPVVLQSLNITPGGALVGNNGFTVRTDFIDYGTLFNGAASVEGSFKNAGNTFISGGFVVAGAIENDSGALLRVLDSGVLEVSGTLQGTVKLSDSGLSFVNEHSYNLLNQFARVSRSSCGLS